MILAGVMLKLGTYGFLRFGIYLFPEAAVYFAPALVGLGTIGIIYGAIAATMQRDLKRLVAYSSVAHLGFIVIGTFALNTEGLSGGILQMVNHGISTGALFLLVGWIYDRRHTRLIAELGGLQKPAPVFAAVFMVVMLSSIGLPGLNGFVGEFLALLGAFGRTLWAVVAATGVIIAALYLLWAYQRVFHGPAEGDNAEMKDLTWSEGAIMMPFLAAIVVMGLYPAPVLERMEPVVDALIEHIEGNVEDFDEADADQGEDLDVDDLKGLGKKKDSKATDESASVEGGEDDRTARRHGRPSRDRLGRPPADPDPRRRCAAAGAVPVADEATAEGGCRPGRARHRWPHRDRHVGRRWLRRHRRAAAGLRYDLGDPLFFLGLLIVIGLAGWFAQYLRLSVDAALTVMIGLTSLAATWGVWTDRYEVDGAFGLAGDQLGADGFSLVITGYCRRHCARRPTPRRLPRT